jgi:hypothetical protein
MSCINIDEYDVFRCDRNVHGGGVCIYVRSCYKAKRINCNSTKEIVGISIFNGKVAIFSVYKPPNSNPDEFYTELIDIVTSQSDQQSITIIAGDTNMNMFDASKKNKVTQYCMEMNVIEWVDKATHLDSCIDHIMVTKGINVTNLQLLSPIEKRHATITCEIILPEQNTRQSINTNQDSKVTVKYWKKASWEDMKSWLVDQNLVNQITDELSIENGWLTFKEKCLMAIELFVPEVRPRRKKRTWLSNETKCAIRNSLEWESSKEQLRIMFSHVHKIHQSNVNATPPSMDRNSKPLSFIIPQTSRRSSRLSNNKAFAIIVSSNIPGNKLKRHLLDYLWSLRFLMKGDW